MRYLAHYLIPDLVCESVYRVPFDRFFQDGIRVVAFDIDSTLVADGTPAPDAKIRRFLQSLQQKGLRTALVSNNKPERVKRFNKKLGLFAVSDAKKPSRRALRLITDHFRVTPREVLLVGDQLLTDVLAARRGGARSVVVRPIPSKENLFFRLKRLLEKPFLKAYEKMKKEGKTNEPTLLVSESSERE